MHRPSFWFVATSVILLTTALLTGKNHLLVPVVGSGILLGYCYAAIRQIREAHRPHPATREEEAQRVEQQRYLLAKEALLEGTKRKRVGKQP